MTTTAAAAAVCVCVCEFNSSVAPLSATTHCFGNHRLRLHIHRHITHIYDIHDHNKLESRRNYFNNKSIFLLLHRRVYLYMFVCVCV